MNKVKTERVYCDLDGVLAWWAKGVCNLFDREYKDIYPFPQRAPWDAAKLFGIPPKDFWEAQNHRSFWADLEKTPEADAIVRLLIKKYGHRNVYLLSSPGRTPISMLGKDDWVAKHFPKLLPRLILSNAKEGCAFPTSLLIDDNQDNVRKFNEAQGYAYLVPRPWNDRLMFEPTIVAELTNTLNYV